MMNAAPETLQKARETIAGAIDILNNLIALTPLLTCRELRAVEAWAYEYARGLRRTRISQQRNDPHGKHQNRRP